ncbi:MAG: hypothetical protein MJ237_04335 [bacterium]|nr:hypothetical protein [bacterium]
MTTTNLNTAVSSTNKTQDNNGSTFGNANNDNWLKKLKDGNVWDFVAAGGAYMS